MASEKLMKTLPLLCADDFVDLEKNVIQSIFINHFDELLRDPEIEKCSSEHPERLKLDSVFNLMYYIY